MKLENETSAIYLFLFPSTQVEIGVEIEDNSSKVWQVWSKIVTIVRVMQSQEDSISKLTWRLHLEWFLFLVLVPIFSEKGNWMLG